MDNGFSNSEQKRIIAASEERLDESVLTNTEKTFLDRYKRTLQYMARNNKRWRFYTALNSAIQWFIENRLHNSPPCYVTSFSENRDQLSQWRGYCQNGGYSIGFKAVELKNAVSPLFVLGECLYSNGRKIRLLDSIFYTFMRSYLNLRNRGMKMKHDGNPDFVNISNLSNDDWIGEERNLWNLWTNWQDTVGRTLARFAPFFKHEGFAEEKEWRCVNTDAIFPTISYILDRKFRAGPQTLIPYTVMSFNAYDLSEDGIEVTVGPMNNKELAKDSISDFLFRQPGVDGFSNNAVKLSNIPYRTN